MLVREQAVYEYLKSFILDNQLSLETCMDVMINPAKVAKETAKVKGSNISSPETALFELALIIVGSMIALIILFGVVYELKIRNKILPRKENINQCTTVL